MIGEKEWQIVAEGLSFRGLRAAVPEESVFTVKGTYLFNGFLC